MSILPHSAATLPTASVTLVLLATSSWHPAATMPRPVSLAASASAFSCDRPPMATRAPAVASASLIASPIPP
jgi:hypothetical protein